jgi:hypothetical protein
MKFPSVYPLTIPSNHSTMRMIAIVSSMSILLAAVVRAAGSTQPRRDTSNGCAVSARNRRSHPRVAPVLLCFLLIGCGSTTAFTQDAAEAQPADSPSTGKQVASFLTGAAIGLAAHEVGHVIANLAFGEKPGLGKVDFHGIPFFAITHRSGLPLHEEFIISSAGFWMQHAEDEWLLTRKPALRSQQAPMKKGVFAFNVLASVAYAGAAFAKTGPDERDTRGMAASARVDERWIGALVLAPALLDAWRYYHPDTKWATWASRGVKVGMVVMVVR